MTPPPTLTTRPRAAGTAPKRSYLIRPASATADECDTVIDLSIQAAVAQWRRANPNMANQRLLAWHWTQNELTDRPAFISYPNDSASDSENHHER